MSRLTKMNSMYGIGGENRRAPAIKPTIIDENDFDGVQMNRPPNFAVGSGLSAKSKGGGMGQLTIIHENDYDNVQMSNNAGPGLSGKGKGGMKDVFLLSENDFSALELK